ncbi:hypothetical protein CPB86DRAFT_788417 [Serendipita vermifera]|nr:hypothetical protein CPB86DRAFT_788417 [Serendipita vermifera]
METQLAYHIPGPSAPVTTVPTEILEEIFMLCFEQAVAEYDENILDSQIHVDVPIRLGAVCARWRQIAHGLSVLWSFIPVNVDEESRKSDIQRLLELYLDRSGGQPLRIAIKNLTQPTSHNFETPLSSLFPLTAIPLDRVHHLTLKEPKSVQGLFQLSYQSMAHLRLLTGFDLIGLYHSTVHIDCLIDLACPILRSLRLHKCTTGYQILTEHNLVESLHLSQIFYQQTSPYTLQLPNLRSLHFTQNRETTMNSTAIPTFQFGSQKTLITHLVLEDVYPSSLRWVDGNNFSALTHLSIRHNDFSIVDHLLQFSRRVGSTITHLELKDVAWKKMPWGLFFMTFETLQRLRICCIENPSVRPLSSVFMALAQPLSTSRRALQYLSHLEIIAPSCPDPLETRLIHRFAESRQGVSNEKTSVLTTPNVFKQEDIQSLSSMCTVHVTEWDPGWSSGWR